MPTAFGIVLPQLIPIKTCPLLNSGVDAPTWNVPGTTCLEACGSRNTVAGLDAYPPSSPVSELRNVVVGGPGSVEGP